jgi:membrane protein
MALTRVLGRRAGVAGFWRRYVRAWFEAVRRYQAHRFAPRAQAIAYNVLFSLIPFLGAAVAGFGLVLRDADTRRRVTDAIIESLAVTTGATGFIQDTTEIIAESSRAIGPLSLAIGVWTAVRAAGVVRLALEDAWGGEGRLRFIHRRLVEAGMLSAVLALLIASTVASGIFGALIAVGSDVFGPHTGWLRILAGAGGAMLALGFSLAAFVLIYRFVPWRGQSWRAALAGGLPAGIAFEGLRLSFTVFVTRFTATSPVYGALTSVFLFLAWSNLAASILLLGAELTVVWEQTDGGRTLDTVRMRLERLRRAGTWARSALRRRQHGGGPVLPPPSHKPDA